MLRKISYLITVLFFISLGLRAQSDSAVTAIQMLSLGLENLHYPVDSSQMRIISAGNISKSLDELPLEVYVISHDEIIANQYTTLTDVLTALPGIQVSKPGTGELGESFQMWNMTGNLYTKILINGVAVKPSVVSGMPIGSQLPIRQAEKIEVIYGNSSAIYGADAVAGVINIVTKEAGQTSFVRGDISLGQNGNNFINFTIGGKGGKNDNILEYSFYGSKSELSDMNLDYADEGLYNPLNYYLSKGDSLEYAGNYYSPDQLTDEVIEDGVDTEDFITKYYGRQYEGSYKVPDIEALGSASNMLGMQLRFKGFSLNYNYMYRRAHSSIGLSPVFYKYNNPQTYWGENIQQLALSYTKQYRKFTSKTEINSLAYAMDNNSSQALTFLERSDKVYRYSASNDFEVSQNFSFSPLKDLEIVAGIGTVVSGNLPTTNFRDTPFDKSWYTAFSTNIDSLNFSTFERYGINPLVFATSSIHLQSYYSWKKFRMLGGLRFDVNTIYGNRLSPHLAVLHNTTDKTSFRLSIGTAYKAPPTSLIYQSLAYLVGDDKINVVAFPNTRLYPEKFSTFELGFKKRFSSRFSLNQTFFSYRIRNHIIPIQIPVADLEISNAANTMLSMWFNSSSTVSIVGGSQTTLRFTDIVPSIKLNAEASFYFQAREDNFPNVKEFVEKYIQLAPVHSGKLKVTMNPTENMYLYIESHWMSKWLRVLIPFEELYTDIFGAADGYYAMNVTLRYHLSDQLDVFTKVTNLFDETYGTVNATLLEESLIYNPQLRRTIRFGLSYRLN